MTIHRTPPGIHRALRAALPACVAAVLMAAAPAVPAQQTPSLAPSTVQHDSFLWTARVLARYRYQSAAAPANAAAPVLERYLALLDPERLLLTQADAAAFAPLRERLARADDSRQLEAAFTIFERMRGAQAMRWAWSRDAIAGPLAAIGSDGLGRTRVNAPLPVSGAEQQTLWRQSLARDVLSLRRAGADDAKIVAILTRRYDSWLARARALGNDDAFNLFMNAYVGAFDPHGVYFPPPAAPGPVQSSVGLVLQKQGEAIVVVDMHADGTAARSGQVHAGDRILAVGQGEGQAMTEVLGWNVADVVALLRGAPGSKIVLSVRPAEGPHDSVPRKVALVRADAAARDGIRPASARIDVVARGAAAYRVGVVTVPIFYQDLAAKQAGAGEYASMTRDVAALLARMKQEHADVVLLDMRGNGGGLLAEAIAFTGLFLPQAPVARQRARDGKLSVETTAAGSPAWDGPLAVLIDEGSAAATEIFAGAIQDYGTGLVIGDRSVGRTSVQTVVPLDRFAPKPSVHYGALKMTVAQVFRASGATFEQDGVLPDLTIPGAIDPSGTAGRMVFPAVPVQPADFAKRGDAARMLPLLKARHEARAAASPAYQALLRVRVQAFETGEAADVDVRQVQMREALQVAADMAELARAGKPPARQALF